MKNYKLVLGYIIAFAGLALLVLNAYIYFSGSGFNHISVGSSLLIIMIGAVLVKNNRKLKV